MKRIVDYRGTGKTIALMEEAYNNNGIFVCQNPFHMREKAIEYGFSKLNIMSFNDFIENIHDNNISWVNKTIKGYKDPEGRKFYVDEIEGFINFICLNTLGGYTLSLE